MATLQEDLDYLAQTKQLIKEAIIEKGQEISSIDTFRSYVDKINNISTGGHLYFIPEMRHSLTDEYIDETFTLTVPKTAIAEELVKGDIILGVWGNPLAYNNLTINSFISLQDNIDPLYYSITFTYLGLLEGIFDTSDANATSNDILSNKTAYVNREKITGSIINNGQLNYTPTISSQSIPSGYTEGGTISGVTSSIDANIIPENIKKDVTILGVTGNCQPEGNYQTKQIEFIENGNYSVIPDEGYDALEEVKIKVEAIIRRSAYDFLFNRK